MASKTRTITVEAAHPTAHYYQEVVDDETGKLVVEMVYAPTDEESGEQIPVAMEMHDTARLRRALAEVIPNTAVGDSPGLPARIVESEGSAAKEHTIDARRGKYSRDLARKREEDAKSRKESNKDSDKADAKAEAKAEKEAPAAS